MNCLLSPLYLLLSFLKLIDTEQVSNQAVPRHALRRHKLYEPSIEPILNFLGRKPPNTIVAIT